MAKTGEETAMSAPPKYERPDSATEQELRQRAARAKLREALANLALIEGKREEAAHHAASSTSGDE